MSDDCARCELFQYILHSNYETKHELIISHRCVNKTTSNSRAKNETVHNVKNTHASSEDSYQFLIVKFSL